jgi:hypothetical protein
MHHVATQSHEILAKHGYIDEADCNSYPCEPLTTTYVVDCDD